MLGTGLTVDHVLRSTAAARPAQAAIVDGGRVLSYADFDQRVEALARFLRGQGVGSGQAVAYLFWNQWELLVTYHAILRLGAVVVSLNNRLTAPELAFQLGAVQAAMLLHDSAFAEVVGEAMELLPSPLPRLVVGGQGDQFGAALASGKGEGCPIPTGTVSADQDSGIWFTSGTTGQPKGAVVTHRSSVASATVTSQMCGMQGGCRLLSCAPMFHRGAMEDVHLAATLVGGTHYLLPRFDAQATLEAIERHAISHAFIVPTMSWMLLRVPRAQDYDLRSMQCWMSASAPLPPRLVDDLQRHLKLRPRVVTNAYGITESLLNAYCTGAEMRSHRGSVGLPVPTMQVAVSDGERLLPAGEHGELVTRGPTTLRTYLNDAAALEAARLELDGVSWYRTGDVGFRDDDGYLYLVDRKKDMIISGGENVYSVEVEQAIGQLPGVAEVAVVGQADEKWGELVVACVTPAGEKLAETDILAACETLAPYKRPRRVLFVERLPRNSFGKLQKSVLKDLLAQTAAGETTPG